MAARWRTFRKPILAAPDKVVSMVKACLCIHNFLTEQDYNKPIDKITYSGCNMVDTEDESGNVTDGNWRRESAETSDIQDIRRVGSNSYSASDATVKALFKDYFCSPEGQVPL